MSTWRERERTKQRWSAIGCALVMLLLITLDRPGLAIYLLDAVAVPGLIVWQGVRRGVVSFDKADNKR